MRRQVVGHRRSAPGGSVSTANSRNSGGVPVRTVSSISRSPWPQRGQQVVPYLFCPLCTAVYVPHAHRSRVAVYFPSKILLHIRHATHCRLVCSSHAMRKRGWASKRCPQCAHVTTWIQKACSKVSSTPCPSRPWQNMAKRAH